MIRVVISVEAFEAIAATLPLGSIALTLIAGAKSGWSDADFVRT